MKTQIYNNIKTEEGVVRGLREIRDNINRDIATMSFEEERSYLDKLLALHSTDDTLAKDVVKKS